MQEQTINGTQYKIQASFELLDNVFENFSNFLHNLNLSTKEIQEWKTLFMEASSSAINQNNKKDPSKEITIAWSFRGDEVHLEVSNRLSPENQKLQSKQTTQEESLNESTHGEHIIQKLSDRYYRLTSTNGSTQIIAKKHSNAQFNPTDSTLLKATLDELNSSYESLTAFYKLGEAIISSETISNFISDAISNLSALVKHDLIKLNFINTLHPALLSELSTNQYYTIKPKERVSYKEEVIWERKEEIAQNPELYEYSCGIECPIRAGDQFLGMLTIARRNSIPTLSAGEISNIRTFSDLIGIATAQENNALHRDQAMRAVSELEIASELQKKLLPIPQLEVNKKWNFFAARKSAREVAGDYVDAVIKPDGSVYFIVVDVMGKGVSAALLAAMIKTAFYITLESKESPLDVLYALNKIVYEQTKNISIFATCCITYIPSTLDRIDIVNAGHCPPLLYHSHELFKEVEASGPPLGLYEKCDYTTSSFSLQKADQLIIVTDGLYEWEYDGHIWGWENFLNFIPSNLTSPITIWNSIQEEILEHSRGNENTDDQTILFWELK